MKKRIFCILCVLTLLLCLIPAGAVVLPNFSVSQSCSLTLSYRREGTPYPGLDISVYRVAVPRADGSFRLAGPFANAPVNISFVTSQQQWRNIADTLTSHIAGNQIVPTQTGTTDTDGSVVLSALPPGLYLVEHVLAEKGTERYLFEHFMVYLPTPADGAYEYDMSAKPKSSQLPSLLEYTVLKLWQDSGNRDQRPASVTVDILKDGRLQETVTLSSANNWSYTWSADNTSVWTVSEKNVPSGYQATLSQRETTFVITNTAVPPPPDDPDIPDPPPPDDPDIPDPPPPDDPDIPDPPPPDDPDTPDTPTPPDNPDTPDTPTPPDDPDTPVPDLPSIPVGPGPSEDPEEPDPPVTPDPPVDPIPPEPSQPDIPKTGDTAPLGLYIMAMCISGLLLMTLGLNSRRSKRHETKR